MFIQATCVQNQALATVGFADEEDPNKFAIVSGDTQRSSFPQISDNPHLGLRVPLQHWIIVQMQLRVSDCPRFTPRSLLVLFKIVLAPFSCHYFVFLSVAHQRG